MTAAQEWISPRVERAGYALVGIAAAAVVACMSTKAP